MNETALREQICLIGRLMSDRRYVDGASGNISARLDQQHLLTTPGGGAKRFLTPEQLVVVDLDGQPIKPSSGRPTSELAMHLECYRQRPDVGGVVHAHPPTATAMTLTGYDFTQPVLPEMLIVLGRVPTAPYSTPSSPTTREVISQLIPEHDAVLLSHHGSLTVGPTVWDAYLRLETLEHSAEILFKAAQLGSIRRLSPDQLEQLFAIRQRLGYLRPGDEEWFASYSKTDP